MHQGQDSVLLPSRRRRRHYTLEHKLRLVQLCSGSGASLSAVAQANDVNANLLRVGFEISSKAHFVQRLLLLDSWPSLRLLLCRPISQSARQCWVLSPNFYLFALKLTQALHRQVTMRRSLGHWIFKFVAVIWWFKFKPSRPVSLNAPTCWQRCSNDPR